MMTATSLAPVGNESKQVVKPPVPTSIGDMLDRDGLEEYKEIVGRLLAESGSVSGEGGDSKDVRSGTK